MAPKKKAPPRELTEDDMRRMQMSEEQIRVILAERAKSKEEKMAERITDDKARQEREAREKQAKRDAEATAQEQAEKLAAEQRAKREAEAQKEIEALAEAAQRDKEARERAKKEETEALEALKKRRAAEMAEYQAMLDKLTPEERAKKILESEQGALASQLQRHDAELERLESEAERLARQAKRRAERAERKRAYDATNAELAAKGIVLDADSGSDVEIDESEAAMRRQLAAD